LAAQGAWVSLALKFCGASCDGVGAPMSDPRYLEIHAALSEDIRNSNEVVWQLAIAIAAAEEGVVALSDHSGFHSSAGKIALSAGFFLSVGLSYVLLRHVCDRRATVRRLHAVEAELSRELRQVFQPVKSSPQWRAQMLLAWFLLLETSLGFLLFVRHLFAA